MAKDQVLSVNASGPDIFISYAREDEAWVRPLAAELARCGWSVFWDRRVPAGKSWRSYIGAALEKARCVVVVWSEHSVRSDFVLQEADEAKDRGILVPVLCQMVRPPFGFREMHAADLSTWQQSEQSEQLEIFLSDLANVAPVQRRSNVIKIRDDHTGEIEERLLGHDRSFYGFEVTHFYGTEVAAKFVLTVKRYNAKGQPTTIFEGG